MKLRIGDILLRDKIITCDQLDLALAVQRRTGALIGMILVGLGYITEKDLQAALLEQSQYLTETKRDLIGEIKSELKNRGLLSRLVV